MYASMEFTVKIGCPNYCAFCPQSKLINAYNGLEPEYLSLQNFQAILAKIPKQVRIDFSGFCEPFSNPEASSMMQIAYQHGYQVVLYTTLTYLRSSDIDRIKDIEFQIFMVHIPDQKYFVYNTDLWLRNFDLIRNAGFSLEFMSMGEVDARIIKIIANIQKPIMQTRAGNCDIISAYRRTGSLWCNKVERNFNQNVLLPNGDVYLCCMDYGLQHKLGNLLTGSYEDLFKGPEFSRVCEAVNEEDGEVICRYCERAINVR